MVFYSQTRKQAENMRVSCQDVLSAYEGPRTQPLTCCGQATCKMRSTPNEFAALPIQMKTEVSTFSITNLVTLQPTEVLSNLDVVSVGGSP